MKNTLFRAVCCALSGLLLSGSLLASLEKPENQSEPISNSTADHSKFEELQKEFGKGPEVTKACLGCHTEASKQLHQTKHWNWKFTNPETGQTLGKSTIVNNFCLSVSTNLPRCTSCHIGYGWKDDTFDFTSEVNVDCLVCHDTTGTYKKYPAGAGHPAYVDKPFPPKGGKKIFKAVDLQAVAQSVGKTSRETCGACHFYGGGGDGVKHGDMDSSMTNPDKQLDVHMGTDGLDFVCADCHTTDGHETQGSRYNITAKDTHGIDIIGRDDKSRASCESCHGMTPHEETINDKLNDHTDRVACQTCHIPKFARGGKPSKTWWDWSTAGRKTADGKHIMEKDENGYVTYVTKKGNFEWGENLVPEYAWLSGNIRYRELEEKVDPESITALNTFDGSYADKDSRIWPFKVMRGKQPYDKVNNTLAIAHLFGKDKDAYWKSYSWDKALAAAMKNVGANFSGEYGFLETTMHWPLAHMIAPKEEALQCSDCHAKDGRLASLTDFYLPGRDSNKWVDTIGWLAVVGTIGGVFTHGFGRLVANRRRKRQ
ncbi:cytochrome C [Solemya velum gill symbiont]|uniref:Cytochrome C n=1 Tax=Solemya velum gill symbiont TaxID=2340 RepID=A0A1T2CU07_SOVGS|nr:tetrathionate reductase family octaheme c-type cytochrome [Solemya velum gill symbiont]OOY35625.1 cytochrome C [Solemya velum gill symbiont]OOY38253.1 cytochrome C [Solemya velum gill symbiont]OOY39156.1 cytochrome C [Solemya velum gill symbiont]OOY44053.1 cytochrome C [Solemya velum gill symbiont]OOY44463.1 cytochrome C [Solemya velum gill symbiont]